MTRRKATSIAAAESNRGPWRTFDFVVDAGETGLQVKFVTANEVQYKLICLLEANPHMSQRDAARELGISLGKVNYCLQALIRKGWVKASNFTNSSNKAAYLYLLTSRGLKEKAALTVQFLQIKVREYEILRGEIRKMRREVARLSVEFDAGDEAQP